MVKWLKCFKNQEFAKCKSLEFYTVVEKCYICISVQTRSDRYVWPLCINATAWVYVYNIQNMYSMEIEFQLISALKSGIHE